MCVVNRSIPVVFLDITGLFLILLILVISVLSIFGFLLGSDLFLDVSVVEKVDEVVPVGVGGELALQDLNLAGQEPVDDGDGLGRAVAAGDGNIDVLKGGVGIAEGDAGDVHVGSFHDGLSVGTGIGNDQDSGLLELLGILIGKGTGHPSGGGGGNATNVVGELDNGSLSIRSSGHDDDVSGVLDGGDDTGGELNLLPGLLQVDDVGTVVSAVADVRLHVEVQVDVSKVSLGGEEPEEIFLLSADGHL